MSFHYSPQYRDILSPSVSHFSLGLAHTLAKQADEAIQVSVLILEVEILDFTSTSTGI